jgi:hypothetical protein
MTGDIFAAHEWLAVAAGSAATLLILSGAAYLTAPWYARWGTRDDECRALLPGDEIVPNPQTSYTLATTIEAAPSVIWPWLVQMGQGRAGFYTHEWVENLLGADIHNADRIVPGLQHLAVGETIRLTPELHLGQRGQFMMVAEIQPRGALVFMQTLPNGTTASWALVLRSQNGHMSRLLSRRRGGKPSLFDRVMKPGYMFMDRGMLAGVRRRAEAVSVPCPGI